MKKILFLSLFQISPSILQLAKDMGLSLRALQIADGQNLNEINAEEKSDIILTDIGSVAKIKQFIVQKTKEQKPVLVFGMTGGKKNPLHPEIFKMKNGMIFCKTLPAMFNLAKAFCMPQQVCEPGVTLLTNSGSLGILGSDICETAGLYQALPDENTLQQLQMLLSRHIPLYNPIYFPPQTGTAALQNILSKLLAGKHTANLILLLAPLGKIWQKLEQDASFFLPFMTNETNSRLHLCFVAPFHFKQTRQVLQTGLPCYHSPITAIQAIRILFDFSCQNKQNMQSV